MLPVSPATATRVAAQRTQVIRIDAFRDPLTYHRVEVADPSTNDDDDDCVVAFVRRRYFPLLPLKRDGATNTAGGNGGLLDSVTVVHAKRLREATFGSHPPPPCDETIDLNVCEVDEHLDDRAEFRVVGNRSVTLRLFGALAQRFIVVQVLQDSTGAYFLLRRAGNEGNDGVPDLEEFRTRQSSAFGAFDRTFKNRTGNEWTGDRQKFNVMPGKFHWSD